MRKITTSALAFLMLLGLHAQPISNIRVTLPQQLPANTAEWASLAQPIIITAQAKPVQGRVPPEVMESRILVTIENAAGKACGAYMQSNAPMSNFTSLVKTWTGAQAVGLLGQECTLNSGDYSFCVWFYGMNMATGAIAPISEKKCFPFTITGNEEYSPPTLINPENGKQYTEADLMRPVTFRWTPLVPKPKEPVTYRLKVWQLMQGQNGTSAMRASEPIITKEVTNVTQAVVNAVITGPCRPPYLCDFVWNVQALSRDGKPMGNNNGTSELYQFKATAADAEIKPPALISPANESRLKLNEAKRSIKFTWTGIEPKPNEPVTYRLKVWQLMQGQTASSIKSKAPLVTKEMTNTTEITVNGVITGPCRPPYLCDFIWEVQALSRSGKPMGTNEGTSETFAFKILDDNINTKIDSVKVGCCENGKQSIYIKIRNLHVSNTAQVTSIKYRVNGTGPLTTLSPTSPGLPFTIAANGTQAFTGSINCVDSMQTIKFIVETVWPTDPDNINTETAWDTLKCACNFCSEANFKLNMPAPAITIAGGAISFSQNYTLTTVPAKPVKSITAELVYFEMTPENDQCLPCNKDDQTYGHFPGGVNTQTWNEPVPGSLPIKINIPPLISCCKAKFRWCIRYKIEFKDCTSCNKLVCYEKEKAGCEQPNDNPIK